MRESEMKVPCKLGSEADCGEAHMKSVKEGVTMYIQERKCEVAQVREKD